MESWPEHLARHSYDAFWMENEPVFHAYDYGANIEIEVSEGLQSLGRETRLRPHEDSDDEADEGRAAGGDESQPRSPRGGGQTEDDNPSVVHKLSGRWTQTHPLMCCTLTG